MFVTEVILLTRGYLTMSEAFWLSQLVEETTGFSWAKARAAAKCPKMYRTSPKTKRNVAQSVYDLKVALLHPLLLITLTYLSHLSPKPSRPVTWNCWIAQYQIASIQQF